MRKGSIAESSDAIAYSGKSKKDKVKTPSSSAIKGFCVFGYGEVCIKTPKKKIRP
jgi:hypothetical protein